MDLPCFEWQRHVERKWNGLSAAKKVDFSSLSQLDDIFAFGQSAINSEDVALLSGISERFGVRKDPQCTAALREEGNACFKARNYTAAALYYSKGVSHAESGSEQLPLSYANRSAALFHLHLFQECLQDISSAIDNGYPKNLQQKLLDRRAQCLSRLPPSAGEIRDEADGRVKGLNAECQVSSSHGTGVAPCVSPSVALHSSPGKGRHLMARDSMLAGEVVLEERAFSCVLIPGTDIGPGTTTKGKEGVTLKGEVGTEDRHCHHCLFETMNPVPCQGCSYARYCGKRCRQIAWEGYHHWECPIGGELQAVGVLAHLALRVALKVGFEEVQRLCQEGPKPRAQGKLSGPGSEEGSQDGLGSGSDFVSSDCYMDGSYLCVHHLLPHVTRHAPSLRFLCAVTAATLCLRLRETGPLPASWHSCQRQGQRDCRSWSLELVMLGVAVLRHMLQLRCNAQAVTLLRDTGSSSSAVQSVQEVRIATAIFPTLSLLNHSCCPNTSVVFRTGASPTPDAQPCLGNAVTVTVRVAQGMAAGQELLHCYGPHHSRMSGEERRRLLHEQYFFLCECEACCQEVGSEDKGQGPVRALGLRCTQCRSALQKGEDGYLCSRSSCGLQLSVTELTHRLQELQECVDQAVGLIERDRPEEALKVLKAAMDQAGRILTDTHPVQGELADVSARAHAVMGEWQQAAAQLSRSVAAVRAQYGGDSAELGRQLFKLIQLHFNGGEPQLALTFFPEARRLLSLHCGPLCEELVELCAMEDCLQGVLIRPRNSDSRAAAAISSKLGLFREKRWTGRDVAD